MIDKQDTLANLELLNESIDVLSKKFQIERAKHNDSIESVCSEKDIDVDFFIEILKTFADEDYLPIQQLRSFPVEIIIDYLHRTHKYYLSTKLPEIENILSAMTTNQSDNGVLDYVKNYFVEFRKELSEHIREEEKHLFPYIKSIHQNNLKTELIEPMLSSFNILHFEEQHDDHIENSITEVRKLIIKLCDDAQEMLPFKVLLGKLSTLEKDLRVHALVENDILLPKALLRERELKNLV